jgi:hypothetical protein
MRTELLALGVFGTPSRLLPALSAHAWKVRQPRDSSPGGSPSARGAWFSIARASAKTTN